MEEFDLSLPNFMYSHNTNAAKCAREVRADPVEARARKRRSHHAIIICVVYLVLLALIAQVEGQQEGDGTTHEQMGQVHYPSVDLTPYISHTQYTAPKNRSSWGIKPVFNLTHSLFDTSIKEKPLLMPGYLMVKNGDTLTLGPKVKDNDWVELIAEYWLALTFIIILIILIVVIPFVGVCYCCFCCCRRCRKGCGPCDGSKDRLTNWICSIILVILILLILAGLIIAFTSNRALDRGLDESREIMNRASDDTCRFLKDVSDHIRHIYVINYGELDHHLTQLLENAHLHIFMDLGDKSGANAIAILEEKLDNMVKARAEMKKLDKLEKDLRFYGTQLKDGVRGAKRDVNYMCSSLMHHDKCKEFLKTSAIEYVDASPCLHFDEMPNTTVFVEGIEKIIKDKDAQIPKKALKRYQEIGALIELALGHITPSLEHDVHQGMQEFEMRAASIRTLIHNLVGNIHMKTLHSTKSFEDVYETFGYERSYLNAFCCIFIVTIIIILIIALIFNCCGRRALGATCLLLAIVVIFCVFSLCVLVGLFYFMVGMVAYEGTCAPLRDLDGNQLFRELDASINLRSFLPQPQVKSGDASSTTPKPPPPLQMSKAIRHCMANESIFDLLKANQLWDPEDLTNLAIMSAKDEGMDDQIFDDDLSKVFLLSKDEMTILNTMRNKKLAGYHSTLYLDILCTPITPDLVNIANGLKKVRNELKKDKDTEGWKKFNVYGETALSNAALQFDTYNNHWTDKINRIIADMRSTVENLDRLILYDNNNFSNSIEVLLNRIMHSEVFLKNRGKHYINALGENLTSVVNEQIDEFIKGLIRRSSYDVGHCKPLAYIYNRGVDHICFRLTDPMNGFWFGILIASLLLLPLLCVAHKLICLWKRIHTYSAAEGVIPISGGCPTCTGAPYVPAPIITCSGGQRRAGGITPTPPDNDDRVINVVTPEERPEQRPDPEPRNIRLPPLPPKKRKND